MYFRNLFRTVLLIKIILAGSSALSAEFARLPGEWYVLPEDANSYGDVGTYDKATATGNTYARSEDATGKMIAHIFGLTSQSLQKSGDAIGLPTKPLNAPTDWVPWHLSELYMDLGISLTGTAGIITGIGDTSVEIRWKQTKSALAKLGIEAAQIATTPPEAEKVDLALDESTSTQQLHASIDRIADAVMATGKVEAAGEADMRDGLKKVVDDLQDIMVDINTYNYSTWNISKFGLDVEVSGSGKVGTGVTVGGAVRLRFEWKRSNYSNHTVARVVSPLTSERRENLRKLLGGVAKELDTVNQDLYASSGFDLTTLKLGIGAYLSAKFGVVKGKIGIMGFAFFTKSTTYANANYESASRPRIILDDEIPLIDLKPVAAHKDYARSKNVRFEEVPGGNGADRVIYFMNRSNFQKGLHKSVEMGAWFAEKAKKTATSDTEESRWVIDQIKPNFALSLEGAFKVVTIGGKVSLEMTYLRKTN